MSGARRFCNRLRRIFCRTISSSDVERANLQRSFGLNDSAPVQMVMPITDDQVVLREEEAPLMPAIDVEKDISLTPAENIEEDSLQLPAIDVEEVKDDVQNNDNDPGAVSSQLNDDIEYLYDVHRRHYSAIDPYPLPSINPFTSEGEASKQELLDKVADLKGRFQAVSTQWGVLEEDIAVFGFASGGELGEEAERYKGLRDQCSYEAGYLERDCGCMEEELDHPAVDLGAVQDRVCVYYEEANRLSNEYTQYWKERLYGFQMCAQYRSRNLSNRSVTFREPIYDVLQTPPAVVRHAPPVPAPRGFRNFSAGGRLSPEVLQEDAARVTEI